MSSKTANTLSHINPSSLLNTTIDHGRILLKSILGVGAYGIVYLGQHLMNQRQYAVKLLTNIKVSKSEIAIHSHLSNHPNILSFEKVVQQQGKTFIILEYAPKGDLFASITHPTQGLMGNNEAIKYIFLQILDAVDYCHQRGVAHRDLKPENILMFPHWKVKLADFGLATCQAVSAEFGCGSTFYFSPECQSGMIRNHQRIKGYSTQQNDIWSLGVILINFATGRNPWKQANMQDPTFAAYVHKPKHFFRRILPGISDELDRILGRIFCLDPALRISLPELRLRVLKCQSFTRLPPSSVPPPPHLKPADQHHHHPTHSYCMTPPSSPARTITAMKWSGSMTDTMLAYIQGYTDDNSNIQPAAPKPVPTPCHHPAPIITATIKSNPKQYQSANPKEPQEGHTQHHHQHQQQHYPSLNPMMHMSHSDTTLNVPCDSLSSSSSVSSSEYSSALATPDASNPPQTVLSPSSITFHTSTVAPKNQQRQQPSPHQHGLVFSILPHYV